jgi:hypothetical protein
MVALAASMTGAALASSTSVAAGKDPSASAGYWLFTGNGGVFSYGTANFGAPASDPARCPVAPLSGRAPQPNGTCWSMAATHDGNGYWVINSFTGAIYRFGNAGNFGSPHAKFANTSPEFLPVMRQIVASADSLGYWVYEVGASGMGTVDHYGDAGFFGDTTSYVKQHPGVQLNGQPVGMAATPDGKGYWEVYSDGGVFAFGAARFAGSMANRPLAAPIVAIAASATGNGYLLVASDGGVFAFGDARFAGSRAGLPHEPIVDIARNPEGPGYWLVSNNGEIFTFGGAPFLGTLSTFGGRGYVYGMATKRG